MNKKVLGITIIAVVAVAGGIGGYLLLNKAIDNIIENAQITIDNVQVLDIGETSISIKVQGKVTNDVSVTATVDPIVLEVLYGGQKIGDTITQKIDINGVESTFDQDLVVTLISSAALDSFSAAFVVSASVDLTIKGTATIKSGEFTVEKDIEKTISLTGFNNGLDFSMNTFGIASATATNFTAVVETRIVNPSQISVNLALVELNLLWNGTQVGVMAIPDFNLVPGNVTQNITCTVGSLNVTLFDELTGALLNSVDVHLQLNGVDAGNILDGFFQSLDFNVTLPGLSAIDVAIISVAFVGSASNSVTMDVDIEIFNPTSGSVMVSGLNFSTTYLGFELGMAEFPDLSVLSSTHTYTVAVQFFPTNMTLLSDIVTAYLEGTAVTLGFEGEATGSNVIADILDGYYAEVMLPPCPALDFEVVSFILAGTTADTVLIDASIQITNPAPATVTIDDLWLDAHYEVSWVGNITASGLTLTPGVNTKVVQVVLSGEKNQTAVEKLLSRHVGGLNVHINLNGTSKISLGGMASTVNVSVILPFDFAGNIVALISQIRMVSVVVSYTLLPPSGSMTATVNATIHNPFTFAFEILQMQYKVDFDDADGFAPAYSSAKYDIELKNVNTVYGTPENVAAGGNKYLTESVSSSDGETCARLYDEYSVDHDLQIDITAGQMLVRIASFEFTLTFAIADVPVV